MASQCIVVEWGRSPGGTGSPCPLQPWNSRGMWRSRRANPRLSNTGRSWPISPPALLSHSSTPFTLASTRGWPPPPFAIMLGIILLQRTIGVRKCHLPLSIGEGRHMTLLTDTRTYSPYSTIHIPSNVIVTQQERSIKRLGTLPPRAPNLRCNSVKQSCADWSSCPPGRAAADYRNSLCSQPQLDWSLQAPAALLPFHGRRYWCWFPWSLAV